jgi:hypothetical protein
LDIEGYGVVQAGRMKSAPKQLTKQLVCNVLCMTILVCAGLLFVLIAYTLLAYPTLTEPDSLGGVAPGYSWLGAGGVRWLYLVTALLFTGPFMGAAFVARRVARTSPLPVGIGIGAGIVGGVIAAVAGMQGYLTAAAIQGLNAAGSATFAGWTLVVASVLGVVATTRFRGAAQALCWGTVTFAVLNATLGLARDLVLADYLARTAWVGDTTCSTFTGHALAGCELGDGMFIGLIAWLVLVPVLGAGPLAVSSLMSEARSRFRTRPAECP